MKTVLKFNANESAKDWEITWVVAVMESTKVGTVEQLRFSRRPCRRNKSDKDNTCARLCTLCVQDAFQVREFSRSQTLKTSAVGMLHCSE